MEILKIKKKKLVHFSFIKFQERPHKTIIRFKLIAMSTIAIKFEKFKDRQMDFENIRRNAIINENLCPICENEMTNSTSKWMEKKCLKCPFVKLNR